MGNASNETELCLVWVSYKERVYKFEKVESVKYFVVVLKHKAIGGLEVNTKIIRDNEKYRNLKNY